MLFIVAIVRNIRQQWQTIADIFDVIEGVAGDGHEDSEQHGLKVHPGFAVESHRFWMQKLTILSSASGAHRDVAY